MRTQTYVWQTASVIRETKDAVTIVFDTGSTPFDYKAGQFINVRLVINGEAVSRSYSLSSCPGEDERPSITVKRVDNGIMSEYILLYAEEVRSWSIEGPFGFFHPTEETKKARHVVLIAGGSGISPVFSIIKDLLKNTQVKVSLFYSNKSWDLTIFRYVLAYLERIFLERFSVHYVFTEERGATSFPKKEYILGRLSRLVLKKLLKNSIGEAVTDAHYFICGPNGLIKTTEEALESLGVSKSLIHKELFIAAEDDNPEIILPDTNVEVLFHFYEQTNLLDVTPGKTILEAALEDRIEVRYSCKAGTCGVCTGKLVSGNVHMRHNYALQEHQLREGYILLCQSHPLSNDVTVAVGI